MKLKYNLIAWSLLGFFAAACDPMDDIYNEIDAEGTTKHPDDGGICTD